MSERMAKRNPISKGVLLPNQVTSIKLQYAVTTASQRVIVRDQNQSRLRGLIKFE